MVGIGDDTIDDRRRGFIAVKVLSNRRDGRLG
jgi:hypothetical protein